MSDILPTNRKEALDLMLSRGGYDSLSPEQRAAVEANWKYFPPASEPAGPTQTDITLANLDREIAIAIENEYSQDSIMDHMVKVGAPKSKALIHEYVRSRYAEAAELAERERIAATKASEAIVRDLQSVPPKAVAELDAAFEADQTEQERNDALDSKCKNYPATDAGNGERFATRWGDITKYCHPRRTWYLWTGKCWSGDQGRSVYRLARETARAIYWEVPLVRDDAKRPILAKWAIQSEGKKRLEDMLFMATVDEVIGTLPEELDADGNLFNLTNGTLELDTLAFREHRKEDLLTKMAGTYYDPAAKCPLWDAHLRLIFDGKNDLIEAFQEHIGYTLLSGNPLNVFSIWHGQTGNNGKSVTLSTLRSVFGGYGTPTSADTFMESRQDSSSARPELVALRGARLVTAVETNQGGRLDEGMIKNMTGGDPITARGLFKDQETFSPEFTPILATNHPPAIRGMDGGIWRRIRLWPFTVRISDEQKITNYDQKLTEEAPGILNWMIEGLKRYYAAGCRLAEPPELMANTNAYRAQQDVLKGFIPEVCITSPGERCLRTDLYGAYMSWCVRYSEEVLLAKEFYSALREHNFKEWRGTNGRYFVGIRLKTPKELIDYQNELDAGGVSYQSSL